MHCYRCGRRVPDRSPRCDNCGQKFNFGGEMAEAASAAPAQGGSAALGESTRGGTVPGAPPAEPAIQLLDPARLALTEATERAATALGQEPMRLEPSVADEPAGGEDITVGKTLSGRLEIVSLLGSGPLGRVYKAVDRKKGTVVAVKAIPALRLPEDALVGRFAETIGIVKGLVHPNLCRVYGAGREGGTAFTITQYVEGLPLRALLEVKRENKSTFGFDEAEPIIAQICQGLAYAHAHLIHGDLKPENVILQVDSLKITDLGFSRIYSPAEWRELQRGERSGKGGGGSSPGGKASPDLYLAPEYGGASPRIDRRADVYSVGAILYEMLTGRVPAGADAPPVSSLNPSVPRAVDRVVAKAMAADPEERFGSATELKEAVFRVLGGDILAEDLESPPIPEEKGTFEEQISVSEEEPQIEIEYVVTEHPRGEAKAARPSDDLTPVGAIELHQPLWEPDEIAVQRTRSDEKKAKPSSGSGPKPVEAPLPERSESSMPALGAGDHASVDLAPEGITVAGLEPTPLPKATQLDTRTPAWLERIEPSAKQLQVGPGSEGAADATTKALLDPAPKPKAVEALGRPGAVQHNELSFGMGEGSPLELDQSTGSATSPTHRPPPDPAPTSPREKSGSFRQAIRATEPPREARSGSEDPTKPRGAPLGASHPVMELPADPPFTSDQAREKPRSKSLDDPTRLRPSPSQVRVSAPLPPPAPPVRRVPSPSGITSAAPPPLPEGTGTSEAAPYLFDAPPPRPSLIARRQSGAGRFLLVLALLGGAGGGGGWFLAHSAILSSIRPPVAAGCPPGMVEEVGGKTILGSERDDPDRDLTEPVLKLVNVAPFCIDRFEYPDKAGEMPRTGVTFAEAEQSCSKEGKRLCDEAEWETACKGRSGTRFPYGAKFDPLACNVGAEGAPGKAAKAGAFPGCGSPSGPMDMSGNVAELTRGLPDWPPEKGVSSRERIVKGGSARLPAWGARCAWRDALPEDKGAEDVGFRCCWSAN